MKSKRIGGIALGVDVDHQNPPAGFRQIPGQMYREGRLPDAALLIIDDDGVHFFQPVRKRHQPASPKFPRIRSCVRNDSPRKYVAISVGSSSFGVGLTTR